MSILWSSGAGTGTMGEQEGGITAITPTCKRGTSHLHEEGTAVSGQYKAYMDTISKYLKIIKMAQVYQQNGV